jgi:hypothetical protein
MAKVETKREKRYVRNGYYKSIKSQEKEEMSNALMVELVMKECRQQPHSGGKKLYYLLNLSFEYANPGCN